jgi:uncharacterized protein with von Willebrand factor type A (vWA) domain
MTTLFQPDQLERDYAFVQDCPEHLLPLVLTLPIGSLSDRVAGVVRWRQALLAGQLPPAATWPGQAVSAPSRKALATLGVVPLLRSQAEIVDELLKDLVEAWAEQADDLEAATAQRLADLVAAEQQRLAATQAAATGAGLLPTTHSRLQEQAAREAAAREYPACPWLRDRWLPRTRAWRELHQVFGDLGQMLRSGFDLAAGVLRHVGWQRAKQLHQLVRRIPQLRRVIQTLGRMRNSSASDSVAETVVAQMSRLVQEQHEEPTPEVPGEVRGIDRSGDLARMLPCESVMLGHPRLRLLWHARRAERSMLTYRVEGVMTETMFVEVESEVSVVKSAPRQERGPVVAVVDTSGSMAGLPEQIAKALVLEAACTAHAEQRRCLLFLYGSRGEIVEQELALDAQGIPRLLEFLGQSFGGGTDIAAMHNVLDRLQQERWRKADVLLVTDGEWSADAKLVDSVREARRSGSRFHGVLIGSGATAMDQLCAPVHRFSDWTRMMDGEATQPVS